MIRSPTPARVFDALRRHGLTLLVPGSVLAVTFIGYHDKLHKEEAHRQQVFQAEARAQVGHLRERVGSLSGKRTCLDCPTDLTGTHGLAPRCQPCRVKRRAAMQAENSRLRRRRHAAATPPKPARAPKPTPTPKSKVVQPKAVRPTPPPPKPKEKIEKANLDGGPWFPGWNGCYPPWRTPFEIQLLESEVGRPKIKQVDVTKQPKFRTGSQRFPIHADEEVA